MEISAFLRENHKKRVNILCEQNSQPLNSTVDGPQSHHCGLSTKKVWSTKFNMRQLSYVR